MKFILLAICLFGLAQAGQIKVSDCGSKTGVIESVDVSNCDSTPCTLKKGEDATLNLKFTSCNNRSLTRKYNQPLFNQNLYAIAVDTSKLTSQINGIKFGVPRKYHILMILYFKTKVQLISLFSNLISLVPFPLEDPDSCKMGATCPVAQGDSNQITLTLPILSIYPSVIFFLIHCTIFFAQFFPFFIYSSLILMSDGSSMMTTRT